MITTNQNYTKYLFSFALPLAAPLNGAVPQVVVRCLVMSLILPTDPLLEVFPLFLVSDRGIDGPLWCIHLVCRTQDVKKSCEASLLPVGGGTEGEDTSLLLLSSLQDQEYSSSLPHMQMWSLYGGAKLCDMFLFHTECMCGRGVRDLRT